MKIQHAAALPWVQLAAAVALAAVADGKTFCIDSAGKVVATTNCLGADKASFKPVDFDGGLQVGDVVPNEAFGNPSARDVDPGLVSGGFGRRQSCAPGDSVCIGG